MYEANLLKLEQLKGSSKTDLLKTDPKQFCKAFSSNRCFSDVTTNNHAEAFNSTILGARACAAITMLEEIRRYVYGRIVRNKKKGDKMERVYCPKIEEKLEHHREIGSYCTVKFMVNKSLMLIVMN